MGQIKLESKNISVIGKELGIFLIKSDTSAKVGSIKLAEKDLNSEADFIEALHKAMDNLDNGNYTVHHDNALFARFDIKNKKIEFHRWSENTGIIMPCCTYFKE